MNKKIYRVFPLILFLFLTKKSSSQTCLIAPSSYKVCLGSSVSFNLATNGIRSKTTWFFGDGSSDTLPTGIHIYSAPGNYTAMVIVKFTNNSVCTAYVTQPIKVFDIPKADFAMSNDSICLSSSLCLTNKTLLGSSGAPIRQSTFLFGDGAIIYNQNNPCHTYTKTGTFIVTLEVEDTNGCISRMEKTLVVTDLKLVIQPTVMACGVVRFTNASNYPIANVKRFYWDFGDGTFDSSSTSYLTVQHTFINIAKCPFVVKLYVQSFYGCSDLKSLSICPLYKFTVNLTEDKKKACWRGNEFNFYNPFNPGASMTWRYKHEGTATWQYAVYGVTAKYNFPTCGKYIIQLEIRANTTYNFKCDTFLYDTIEVLGPIAHIELDTIAPFKVVNHFMCLPDTTRFVSPTLYQSKHCNATVKRLWNFADLSCPQCTTDTKNGINVNLNCRWSKDSINVKHKYTIDNCYYPNLQLWDTITGCEDRDSIEVILGKPDLSKIKITGKPCLGAVQSVDLSQVYPLCNVEEFWFNKDTICQGMVKTSWVQLKRENFNFVINRTCLGDSSVIGFVMKNGNCYDTFYYVKHFPKLHTRFKLTNTVGCAPFTTTTFILDSFQMACTKAVWNWGDGSSPTIDSPIINGFVKSQTHTYLKNGLYSIQLTLYDTTNIGSGCISDTTYMIGIGFHMQIGTTLLSCNGYVNFLAGAYYYSNPFDPGNPYRPFLGSVKWYYGDGVIDTAFPSYYYKKAGRYKIKIVATDSSGCIDSIEGVVKVNEFKVGFTYTPKILVCGQIVQFTDTSFVKDSTDILPADSIISRVWDFGDQRALSTLKNPAHAYFVNGEFFVKLVVTTLRGCKDSVIIKINIAGPQPGFELISDSIGCAPYSIQLRNTSIDCNRSIIYMGDIGNTNFVLNPNDTLNYTYLLPGIYYIYIFGEASFQNPNTGSNVYCSAWYPDKTNPKAKLIRITVLAKPPVKFLIPDTICVNTKFDIINTSNKRYNIYKWDYGDSSTEIKIRPDTNSSHSYLKTGIYNITLKPNYTPLVNQKECPDTFSKSIVVVDLKPDFTMDTSAGPVVKFYNTSVGATSYLWDFGHPKTGNKNFSRDYNAEHDYLNDTGVFNICLTAYNIYGCEDSICKPYRNTNFKSLIIPNVFTIDGDGINDAFDIEIHGEIFYSISIFNRWGTLVFQSSEDGLNNDGNNWNGKLNNTGEELPPGEYYFKVDYQFRGEDKKVHKGIVTMIR